MMEVESRIKIKQESDQFDEGGGTPQRSEVNNSTVSIQNVSTSSELPSLSMPNNYEESITSTRHSLDTDLFVNASKEPSPVSCQSSNMSASKVHENSNKPSQAVFTTIRPKFVGSKPYQCKNGVLDKYKQYPIAPKMKKMQVKNNRREEFSIRQTGVTTKHTEGCSSEKQELELDILRLNKRKLELEILLLEKKLMEDDVVEK